MNFGSSTIQTTYIDNNDLKQYLINKLHQTLGFTYEVFVSTVIWENHLGITIDQTTMTPLMHKAIQDFKTEYNVQSDRDILFEFIKQDDDLRDNGHIKISHLVPDLEGVYIICDKQVNL